MKTPRLKKRGVTSVICNGLTDLNPAEYLNGKTFLSLIEVGANIHFVILDELLVQ